MKKKQDSKKQEEKSEETAIAKPVIPQTYDAVMAAIMKNRATVKDAVDDVTGGAEYRAYIKFASKGDGSWTFGAENEPLGDQPVEIDATSMGIGFILRQNTRPADKKMLSPWTMADDDWSDLKAEVADNMSPGYPEDGWVQTVEFEGRALTSRTNVRLSLGSKGAALMWRELQTDIEEHVAAEAERGVEICMNPVVVFNYRTGKNRHGTTHYPKYRIIAWRNAEGVERSTVPSARVVQDEGPSDTVHIGEPVETMRR